MDRTIVYPGSIPLETDILTPQRDTMIALGALMRAVFGVNPVVDGFLLSPTAPASMAFVVGPGSITAAGATESQSFGSLGTDPAALIKHGLSRADTRFAVTAPTTAGYAINYIVQVAFAEVDTDPVVLTYYNAADPSQPYTGPGNSGVAQNTRRAQRAQLQLKAGAAAPAGTQPTPAVDAGWIGIASLTVNAGQTAITAANLAGARNAAAPFVPYRLQQLTPGFSRSETFYQPGQAYWTVPAGHRRIRIRAWGAGGGGGGSGAAGSGGGAGSAGGYVESIEDVVPGSVYSIIIGAGGAGAAGAGNGAAGGPTLCGGLVQISGGGGGIGSPSGLHTASQPAPGQGSGGTIMNLQGHAGGFAYSLGSSAGLACAQGGAAPMGGVPTPPAVSANALTGPSGSFPGGGGAGGVNGGAGGRGGDALVILEY